MTFQNFLYRRSTVFLKPRRKLILHWNGIWMEWNWRNSFIPLREIRDQNLWIFLLSLLLRAFQFKSKTEGPEGYGNLVHGNVCQTHWKNKQHILELLLAEQIMSDIQSLCCLLSDNCWNKFTSCMGVTKWWLFLGWPITICSSVYYHNEIKPLLSVAQITGEERNRPMRREHHFSPAFSKVIPWG